MNCSLCNFHTVYGSNSQTQNTTYIYNRTKIASPHFYFNKKVIHYSIVSGERKGIWNKTGPMVDDVYSRTRTRDPKQIDD